MLFAVLSDALTPAKDVFLIGGLPGVIVAGGMAFAYGVLFLAVSFTTMMLAAVIAGFALPTMMGLSFHGLSGLQENRPILDFGRCLLIVVVAGAAYWAWRGFCFFVIGDAKYTILADAAGTMLLMGICAYLLDRMRARQAGMKA